MNRGHTLLRILRHLLPHRALIVGFVLANTLNVLALLLIPYVIGLALDTIVGVGNVDIASLTTKLGILIALILASGISNFISEACTASLAYRSSYDIRMRVFNVLNYAPISEVDTLEKGDTLSKIISDIEQIGIGFTFNLPVLLSGILTVIGTIIFMLSINIGIGLVVVLLTPISLLLAFALGKKSYSYHFRTSQLRGDFTAKLEEVLNYNSEVKSYNMQQSSAERLDKINSELYEYGLMAQFLQAIGNPGTRFINNIIYAVIAVFGGLMAAKGSLSLGVLVMFLTFAAQYAKPFNEFTTVISDMQAALSSGERVFFVTDKELLKEEPSANRLEASKGNISAKNISFSYEKGKELLQDISFEAKSGDVIAIVGKTGSGKTTLINLLMRFYEIDKGQILIDGKDIYSFNRGDIRKRIGMVLQDTWLFTGTLRDNIAYGKMDASDGQIQEVCKMARCAGFIKRLEYGWDTIIGEGGKKLSKGQAQLIAIARVMLMNPDILILDEATSDIDTLTEIRIQDAFARLMKGKTTFVVAHRLSTIKGADLILVMDEGNIVEKGSHKELMQSGGIYNSLYKSK